MGASTVANTAAAPVVVPPSGSFDGNDGPWSTFSIHVGTPPQPVRVLVSTVVAETWVISDNATQGGCLRSDDRNCPESRGGLFNINASSTWDDRGIFAIGAETNLEDYVGGYDNGDYGFDALGLGLAGSGGIRFASQVISAIATKDFYLGHLGLTTHRTNFTDFNQPEVTFLESMKASNNTPSLSYAYSAGARYRNESLATLTIGGYDSTRSIFNEVPFQMVADISREIVVGLQSIMYSDARGENQTLSTGGTLTTIDATVPHIWLPRDVCENFESAFGIVYNKTINRYLVNDTLHDQLQLRNVSVSFTLGESVAGGPTVNITLPYAAFDLELGPPFVNKSQRYFPLRRAANDTQYTLGRTFLQESYLIVDYERRNFSVSQNVWRERSTPQIFPIAAVDNGTDTATIPSSGDRRSISAGGIAGVVLGIVVGLVAAALVNFFILRKRRRNRRVKETADILAAKATDESDPFQKAEMDGSGKDPPGELDATPEAQDCPVLEMNGEAATAEVEGSRAGIEIPGDTTWSAKKKGQLPNTEPVEMDAGSNGLSEAPAASPTAPKSIAGSLERLGSRVRPPVRRKPLPGASDGK